MVWIYLIAIVAVVVGIFLLLRKHDREQGPKIDRGRDRGRGRPDVYEPPGRPRGGADAPGQQKDRPGKSGDAPGQNKENEPPGRGLGRGRRKNR